MYRCVHTWSCVHTGNTSYLVLSRFFAMVLKSVVWTRLICPQLRCSCNTLLFVAAIIGKYPLCPPGCTSCSEFNGCATCEPDMFMLLRRRGARQTGACLRTCPPGYYGVKRKDYNKCNSMLFAHDVLID